tara:strand:- start:538 stop:1416 length:879 start_codon:yes stop_codon:yes gene_type:complete
MANSTSANLKLTVQQTGENAGTWGQVTNTNLLILEQAIGGFDALNVASSPTALTFSNGAKSNGKNQVLKLTGTISGNVDVTIPNTILKTYIVDNATSGAHTVTLKYVSGGSSVTWSATDKGTKLVYADGTNVLEGISSMGDLIAENITTSNLTVTNDTNVSGITISDNVTAANNITTTAGNMVDQIGEVRTVPKLDKTASYTLTLADHGKFIRTNSNIVVPVNVFTASDAGKSISIFNNHASSSISITRASGAVLYWVQTGADADRTLSSRGLATILCVGNNTFVITGGLLS